MNRRQFDFVGLAFSRMQAKLDKVSAMSMRDYYQFCGVLFSLKKQESRLLLQEFQERYGEVIEVNQKNIRIKPTTNIY